MSNEIKNIAEQFQDECHDFIDNVQSTDPRFEYQDIESVWLFTKLAELEFRLRQIENQKPNQP